MDKKTILIVEDEQIAALDLQETLESLGYRVAGIARTGERAILMVDAMPPDLILMDISLAGAMTGIEAAEQILSRHAIPIIYVTAYADPELVERAKKTRPYGYIIKPYNEREIQTEISIALYKFALEEAFRKEHAELEEWLKQRTEELRHADQKLRRSEAWYRLIFERSGEGIFIFEAGGPDRGRFIDVNAAGLAIHGYSRDELLEMKITDLDVPENVQGAPALFDAVMTGEWIAGETDHVRKDGTVFPVDFRAGLLELEGHTYIFTFLRDISERRRGEDALRVSEEKYRSILENMQDLFYRTDMAGKITMLSPAGARLAGYDSVDELIGMDASAIYAEPEDRAKLLRVLEEKGSVTNFPLVLRVRDGSSRHVIASSHYYRDEDGKIAGIEGILHDITGPKKTKDALQAANRKLNLLSSITRHDIRNQLMALKAYIELCTDSMDDRPQLSEYLGKLGSVAGTIERRIEFTRLYEDMGIRAPVWQNIEALVRDAASALPLGAVTVVTDCHNIEILADSLLEKVFYNLIDNALRYGGPAMTEIRVTAQETAGGMTIVVEDNGLGIMAKEKARIFERGFGKNTGLGLFLSQEILAITGITITETGEPGHGARFGIDVPKGAWRNPKAA